MGVSATCAYTPTGIASVGLFALANRVLYASEPLEKVRLTREAVTAWQRGAQLGTSATAPVYPARPIRPEIVTKVPSARELGVSTRVHLLHQLAHVELNAMDLCADTLVRFGNERGLEFAGDMLSIAGDEARHFETLNARLLALGSSYGALPAHDVVWRASALCSQTCCTTRLALAQLVQEARALDAGDRLVQRLVGCGDSESAGIVATIAKEELRHVTIGVNWFVSECQREAVDPVKRFHEIALQHANLGAFSPPFNKESRSAAGMQPDWYLPVANELQKRIDLLRQQRSTKKALENDAGVPNTVSHS